MNMLTARLFSVLACMLFSSIALADWTLQSEGSNLSFVSVKKDTVGEVHQFTKLKGDLTDSGAFEFTIDLSSVSTGIDIRNERMKEYLFSVAKFPVAKATGAVDPKVLKKLKRGVPTVMDVEIEIDLHGFKVKKTAALSVVKLSRKQMLVVSVQPLLVSAGDFGLSAGIQKLKELAALPSIAESVPVTVNLLFSKKR